MISDTIQLSTVDALIAERRELGQLPQEVKDQFERDSRRRHGRRLRSNIISAIMVYNLLLVGDLFLASDMWRWAVEIHLLIITPLMLGAALAIPKLKSRLARETLAAALPLAMSLQVLFIFLRTTSAFADHYQYFVLLNMLFLGMILRPNARLTMLICGTVFGLHFVAVHFLSNLRWEEACVASLILFCGIYITAMGNLRAERKDLRGYLFHLRESLRHAQADASSRHDKLTGLLNRGGLHKALAELWAGPHAQVAAVMIDIDHFKAYNDVYGHLAGDACLKRLAGLIAAEARKAKDVVARFGGEEFLVLLPNTDLGEGSRIAERMRRSLAAMAIPHEGLGPRGVVSASFGVGSAATKTMTSDQLISAADIALYHVKKNGRDGVWPCVERPVLRVVGPGVSETERRSA